MCLIFLQIDRGGGQKLSKLRCKVGAVLIEFAFAIPVFLVLIYYIHDLPKQKLLQRKMQFVANETAAILQNIATQRSMANQVLTKQDVINSMGLSFLTIFPGNTLRCSDVERAPLGYTPFLNLHYVKGTGVNSAKRMWSNYHFFMFGDTRYLGGSNDSSIMGLTQVNKSVSSSSICPELYISGDEVKILVECSLWYADHWFFPNGIPVKNISTRKAFGFLLFNPKKTDKMRCCTFTAVAIFSPQSGFSETSSI